MALLLAYGLQRCVEYIMGEPRQESPPEGCVRELGFLEKCMEDLHKDGILMAVKVLFLESKVLVTDKAVTDVLQSLANQYPMLRMTISQTGSNLYWKEMEDFTPEIRHRDDGDWLTSFETNSAETFDVSKGPLWRVTVISNVKGNMIDPEHYKYQYAFVFGYHHSLCDGKASMIIMNDLQILLNEYFQVGQIMTSHPVNPANRLAKPFEFYLPLQLSIAQALFAKCLQIPVISSVIQKVCEFGLLRFFRQKNAFFEYVNFACDAQRKQTSTVQVPFTKEDTQRLLAACKSHNVTVQGVLQAASCLAVNNILRNPSISRNIESLGAEQDVSVNCSMNLKHVIADIPDNAVGCYVSCITCAIKVKEDSDFWVMAQECKKQIHQDRLASAGKFQRLIYLSRLILTDEIKRTLISQNRGRFPLLLISFANLGNASFLNMDSTTQIRINGHVSGSSEHQMGPTFANSVITINGRLFWNVLYYTNVHRKPVVDAYVSEVKQIIENALQQ